MRGWISVASILCLLGGCSRIDSSHEPTSPAKETRPVENDAATRRTAKSRQSEPTQLSLSQDTCKNSDDFINAISQTAPLVVGVAAGEMSNKKFSPKALGTGIILSSNGLILTHYHTVGEHSSIRVRLHDGTVRQAEWLGEDRRSDLVLLDIEGEAYPTPNLASADTLAIGQWVASLGGPFGVQQSVSAGLVSNRSRPYPSPVESKLVRFVQSDIVIHPGSSGGPLIDSCGRIVAMNSAILGPGMSFSIRIDHALTIAEKLLAEGEFERGYVGIVVAVSGSSPKTNQLRIKRVVEGSPAAKAGLKTGDVITAIDKKSLSSEFDIKWLVAITEPGELLSVSILRGNTAMLKSVEVDSSP
ncbi:MAG: S1C family serine protease [Bradymonadia bacterium]